MAGASAAYTLSAHGSVLLLEMENTAGYHASGRSAALFTRNFGGPIVRQINAASAGFFGTPPAGFCTTQLLTPRGCLTVAPPGEESALDALLALSETGEVVCEITPQEACEMVPFLRPDRVQRAAYERNVSDIDVATLHLSFLNGACKRGARVLTGQAVTGVSHQAGAWRVDTASDSYSAATIINAAGAWADRVGALAKARPIGLVPKRRSAIIIKAPEGVDCAALPVVDFEGTDAYIKPDAGKLMASPGDATPTDPHDAWADDMEIAVLADWIERETRIKVARIEHSWAGLRSFVADEAPVVGFDSVAPGFFWLAAQGGYGIMMAPVLAVLTQQLCTGAGGFETDRFAQALSPDRLTSPSSGKAPLAGKATQF